MSSYFCPDSDANTDSVNHTGYGTIGHRHHKYVIEYSDMDMISDVEYLDSDTDRSKRL
jgi:hypothetical protein